MSKLSTAKKKFLTSIFFENEEFLERCQTLRLQAIQSYPQYEKCTKYMIDSSLGCFCNKYEN
jgi:hypothetical protein